MGAEKEKSDNKPLKELLEFDKKISYALSLSASKTSPLGYLRPHMKLLEYSCHGLFWISGSVILLWFTNDPRKEAFCFNLLLALIIDIIFVAVLKAYLCRKRPSNNESKDMFFVCSVDKMSCPSGHTSRAVLLNFLLIFCTPGLTLLHVFLTAWCICTCASRVMLGRHFVGDVLIGSVLGYLEYLLMLYLWADSDTAKWYLDIFRDSGSIVDDL